MLNVSDLTDDERVALGELAQHLDDPVWRLNNLYKIIIKDEDDDDDQGLVITFKPNLVQRLFLASVHFRNLVLKARQRGFTTLIALLWLDTSLFSREPMRCGIVAHEREAAEAIFRDKVVFAYENLPDELKRMLPVRSQNKTEIVFGHNGASVRVATSMRSGTIHRLHISEFGKICAKYPAKAREIMTGSLPSVPMNGVAVIESTAEGQDGYFHDMVQRALAHRQQGKPLTRRDYKLHFAPWWNADDYRLSEDECKHVVITDVDRVYFTELEQQIGRPLPLERRAWWIATRDNELAGEAPLMWQEYPGTPQEAFKTSTDGCYYATQLAAARRQGRIRPNLPIESGLPVWVFWDLGRGDMTALWVMQKVGVEHRFIDYYENSGHDLAHYAKWLQDRDYVFAKFYLPHDAAYKRLGENPDTNRTLQEILEGLMPGVPTEIVPRISNLQTGIQQTRDAFASSWFDEERCKDGLVRLSAYRKKWDRSNGRWMEEPLHDDASHGADAYRQFGQARDSGARFESAALMTRNDGSKYMPGHGTSAWRRRRLGGSAMSA